jgi:hypothetical protein
MASPWIHLQEHDGILGGESLVHSWMVFPTSTSNGEIELWATFWWGPYRNVTHNSTCPFDVQEFQGALVTASSSADFVKVVIQWSHRHFLSCQHYHDMFQASDSIPDGSISRGSPTTKMGNCSVFRFHLAFKRR